MRIAVSTVKRETIAQHAGQCRRYLIYETDPQGIVSRQVLELDEAHSLHASHDLAAHPLGGVDVLIAGSMGEGLFQRLSDHGILPCIVAESDPEIAVTKLLLGELKTLAINANPQCGGHHHDHHHHPH